DPDQPVLPQPGFIAPPRDRGRGETPDAIAEARRPGRSDHRHRRPGRARPPHSRHPRQRPFRAPRRRPRHTGPPARRAGAREAALRGAGVPLWAGEGAFLSAVTLPVTRRDFFSLVGRAGGASAVYGTLDAMGLLGPPATAAEAPKPAPGSGRGVHV